MAIPALKDYKLLKLNFGSIQNLSQYSLSVDILQHFQMYQEKEALKSFNFLKTDFGSTKVSLSKNILESLRIITFSRIFPSQLQDIFFT